MNNNQVSLKIDARHLKKYMARGEQTRIAKKLGTNLAYVNQVLHGTRYNEKIMDELLKAALKGEAIAEKINSFKNK